MLGLAPLPEQHIYDHIHASPPDSFAVNVAGFSWTPQDGGFTLMILRSFCTLCLLDRLTPAWYSTLPRRLSARGESLSTFLPAVSFQAATSDCSWQRFGDIGW